ncbi:PTS system, mannose-specific IIA component [Dissulfuribacter thermophilus]|uniref:PTS system, mannose-specific IIA component n=1 Tax=Dissulfuribacter thermophilus TaxID=1156395 RepID=A0A1B9F3Z4_9BACT|nr:PTS sugar transporter subunit IIA [Dissulfuribacter thermophilus]OCC14554.1 PTS system, mannose-specific IIA component [Dissulfuribacter thermophilus]
MVGIIIAAHGNLAQELLETTKFIVGEVENIVALTIDPSQKVDKLKTNIRKAIKQVDQGDGVLILTDMFGGTPSNISLTFLEKGKIDIVTGVNLPMLIRLSQCRSKGESLEKVTEELVTYGRKSINQASGILKG